MRDTEVTCDATFTWDTLLLLALACGIVLPGVWCVLPGVFCAALAFAFACCLRWCLCALLALALVGVNVVEGALLPISTNTFGVKPALLCVRAGGVDRALRIGACDLVRVVVRVVVRERGCGL